MEGQFQASGNSLEEALVRRNSGDTGRNHRFEQIIGDSSALEAVFEQVECVAPTDSTVLIQGETGTGKELIARAIHNSSSRIGNAFVSLNCAAIPFDLLESELFGHEKGAFTSAIAQRVGRFEMADKGTLFLDEIGDIPLALQPKLLRVLQEQEFERLGSTRTRRVDVRVVAATHRDLTEMVKQGEFRSDLYYRINVFPVRIPPLRERRDDIPLLVEYFMRKFARRMGRHVDTVPAAAMDKLVDWPWPGNVRELQNMIERGVILSRDSVLEIPLAELIQSSIPTPDYANGTSTLESVEREYILQVLRNTSWVIGGPSGAAASLGLNRSTLNARMRKLDIRRPRPV
jgi:formate hydrogenlyase transcriptional activator